MHQDATFIKSRANGTFEQRQYHAGELMCQAGSAQKAVPSEI